MRTFVANILLSAVWMAMTRISAPNLLLGFVLGYFVLWLSPGVAEGSSYFLKVGQTLRFTGFFLRELAIATVRITHDILTPTSHMRPAVLAIPLDARTDLEITMLAIVVTLTPGTLALDVSSDRRTLYIHAMFVDDPERLRRNIKSGFEARVLELLR